MYNLSLKSVDYQVYIFDDIKTLAKIHNRISYTIRTELKRNILCLNL